MLVVKFVMIKLMKFKNDYLDNENSFEESENLSDNYQYKYIQKYTFLFVILRHELLITMFSVH